jgi:hypothetical protein
MYAGQAEVAAGAAEDQLLMIEAEQREDLGRSRRGRAFAFDGKLRINETGGQRR